MGGLADRVWERVTTSLESAPRGRVELVLVDNTDSANGYATRFPVNTIVIFVTAPQEDSSLSLYSDWNELILTHELTHIVHLDTVGGLPRVLRLAMGQLVSVNELSPGWIIEGLAVWQETALTDGGRGRSPHADMVKRSAVLAGQFPPLGNLDGFQADPPAGNLRYLFGQDFVEFVVERHGEESMSRWIHTYGRWVVPYWLPARKVFGETWRKMYRDWRASMEERYAMVEEEVRSRGLVTGRPVTSGMGDCGGPAWSPDGEHLLFGCNSRETGSAIWLADAGGAERRVLVDGTRGKNHAWHPDGRMFVFHSAHEPALYTSFNDIFYLDLDAGRTHKDHLPRMTTEARVRDPAFSPCGRELWVVTDEAQQTDLLRLTMAGRTRRLTEATDGTQLSTPTFSPSGDLVALAAWKEGHRDLWLYSPHGEPLERLMDDVHNDRDPAWHPGGGTLFFSSDRSGIPNIYALDLEDRALWQVTNVLGGAFQPAVHPDGTRLAYAEHQWDGAEIRLLELDRSRWTFAGTLAAAGEPGGDLAVNLAAGEPGGDIAASPAAAHLESRPYNPIPSLLPPRHLLPSIYMAEHGVLGAVETSGWDVLRFLQYSGVVTWRSDNGFIGGGGSLVVNRWRPVFSGGATVNALRYGALQEETRPPPEGGPTIPSVHIGSEPYFERRIRPWLQVAWPLDPYSSLFTRYTGEHRSPASALPDDVYMPGVPTRGYLSSIGGGWLYSRGERYAYSISPEEARAMKVVGRYFSPLLGSHTLDTDDGAVPFQQLQLSGEIREYTAIPWLPNHVLAARAAVGLSVGDQLRYGSYRLGGSFGEGNLYVLPEEYRALRGYPVGADFGDWYYLGSLEYRFPLWRVDRGMGMVPFFLRTIHGTLFADVGEAFGSPFGEVEEDSPGEPLIGVGVELGLNMVLGWNMGLNTRIGYAAGLTGEYGYQPGGIDGLYVKVGSSF